MCSVWYYHKGIDQQLFACFPEYPTYVTYPARLEGTSETESGSLISLMEEWVSGGASIIVTGVLMTLDSEHSVAISSLSEGECSTTTDSNNTTIVTIIGGGVVIFLIIILTAVIAVTLIVKHFGNLSMKHRHG